jgi:hypothetical protein
VKGLIETHKQLQQLSMWTYPHRYLVDCLVSAMTVVQSYLKDFKLLNFDKEIHEVKFDLPNAFFCTMAEFVTSLKSPFFQSWFLFQTLIMVDRSPKASWVQFWIFGPKAINLIIRLLVAELMSTTTLEPRKK